MNEAQLDQQMEFEREDHSMQFRENNRFSNEVHQLLRDRFNLQNFRSGQLEIINAILEGYDSFVLMPTNGGKSLCYQLPALVNDCKGVTVVISPFIASITDHVNRLDSLEIRAKHLCSNLDKDEIKKVISHLYLEEPQIDLLYITPDRIINYDDYSKITAKVWEALDSLHSRGKLARFVFDEVHCLSLWADDIRPTYEELGILREKYNDVQILYFTATATRQAEDDVIDKLKLKNVKRFTTSQSFKRLNIKYKVIDKIYESEKRILKLIKKNFLGKCGIVYCFEIDECEILSKFLKMNGIAARSYHSKIAKNKRDKRQSLWMENKVHVIVATDVSFIMGIHKPNIRYVIHATMPRSLGLFYLQSGMAGRDGEVSYSYIFNVPSWSSDSQIIDFTNNQVDCRRYLLLQLFGEPFNRNQCIENVETICDNCEKRRLNQ